MKSSLPLPFAPRLLATALLLLTTAACAPDVPPSPAGDSSGAAEVAPADPDSTPLASEVPGASSESDSGSAVGPSAETGVSAMGHPDRIVSLSASATEILFAIGAGSQVVAVDDQSDYPPEAPMTSLSGFETNVEALSEYDPDLVVMFYDPGDVESRLAALDIPVLMQPAAESLDDTYDQIAELGERTGHEDVAGDLIAAMKAEIDALLASVPPFEAPPTYYYELDQHYYSLTSNTFVGQIMAAAGLENIADAASGAGSDYPQLSAEFIVGADPDLIFLADVDCCDQSLETLRARPGWQTIAAVQSGHVVELDDDIASRWGPRVVELVRAAVGAAETLE